MLPQLDADVRKLRCIFFQQVRDIVEIEWYGLKCNLDEKLEIIEKAKMLLFIYDNCFQNYEEECLIRDFVKRYYNVCKITLTSCSGRESVQVNVSES